MKMESHVLIPKSLTLISRPPDATSPSVARLLEENVGVAAGREGVAKGTRFGSAHGSVRCGKLHIYSTLPLDDVSKSFS